MRYPANTFIVEVNRTGHWNAITSIRFVPDGEEAGRKSDLPRRKAAKVDADRQMDGWRQYHLFAGLPMRIREART